MRADAAGVDFQFGKLVGVRVARDGSSIARTLGAARSSLRVEATWGAGLVLALALQGSWCMHASAVARRGRCFLIMGSSGRGKSTLAARIAGLPGWKRAADDIAPVRATGAGVRLFPHFPQLKLRPDPWPDASVPRSLPLAGVFVLRRDARPQVSSSVLDKRHAAMALVAGTAGTRLFPPDVHERHLADMARMVDLLPVHVLRVPDDAARLDATAAEAAALFLAAGTGEKSRDGNDVARGGR